MRSWIFGLLSVVVLFPVASWAEDWPQWRGARRDGVARGARLPSSWPEALPLKWRVPAGPGYSTPVVSGGRVYFMERQEDDEVVRCLDAATGRSIWSTPYTAPYKAHRYARKHGNAPKATTTVVSDRLYSFGISGVLCSLDTGSGKILWKRDLGREFESVPLFGASASPLVAGGLVVLPVGHKGSGGALMAFRRETGEIAWRAVKDGPSYCSPIVADLLGVRQVISFTEKHLVGVALADGRELWSYPFELPFGETIVTPMVWGDVIIAAGRDQGGTRALRLRLHAREGGQASLEVEELWVAKAPVYMSSPVIARGDYYGVEHKTGKLFCLRLRDGSVAWKEGSFGDYASLVVAGSRILILDSSGRLTVIEASPEAYRRVAEYKVSEVATYAHLVVVESCLIVRDAASIQCFDFSPAVSFRAQTGRVDILVGGQTLGTYVYEDEEIPRPYLAHLHAPGGVQVTRNHPPRKDDIGDHAEYHPGLWLAFGDLAGEDSWRLKAPVVHDGFVAKPEGGPGRGGFTVRNSYRRAKGESTVCTETCRYTFLVRDEGYLVLWESTFTPTSGSFAFGDQEEMGLGLRVATPLAVKSQQGGRILDSEGRRNGAGVWGTQADWADYSGRIEGRPVGVTLFSDPDNFRRSWHHARDYGLLVANPFGRKAMTGGAPSRTEVESGKALVLRFGVLLHATRGESPFDPAAAFADFQRLLPQRERGRQ